MSKVTQQQKEVLISNLKNTFTEQIQHIIEYVCIAEEINITNEQFFIEYENWLNKLSTLDHTKPINRELKNKVDLDSNILI